MSIEIGNSVGFEGMNNRSDVIAIQQALNRVPPNQGGPRSPLRVDGLSGPALLAAIGNFQLRQFRWADFRINRTGATLRALNALINPNSSALGVAVPIFNRREIQNFTREAGEMIRTEQTFVKHTEMGKITNFSGECYINGERLGGGRSYNFRQGDRIGTLDDGRLTLNFTGGGNTEMYANSLVVILGRNANSLNAGNYAETRLELGNLRAHLSRLAGR